MAESDALHALGVELAQRFKVSAIVHNAAVQPLGGAGETSLDEWTEALRVNVVAVDLLVAATKGSLCDHEGSVVAISSVHARATTPGIAAYATTKAALDGWVRAAALDLGPLVRVNSITPGAIDTAKLREGFARWGDQADERRRVLEERTALRRIGRPDEIAAIASFLVSTQSRFITGSTIVADGGATVRLGSE
jgi:NAD(P)-dependent dehydrogenase (short-subunit alcohol dehydrogenase family)